ncbi:hypothetical protein COTS27_00604 [Spirochaetota bacterium]|nr:hypothetical protein COTS27_00604 [Spirochaetota bacterium]
MKNSTWFASIGIIITAAMLLAVITGCFRKTSPYRSYTEETFEAVESANRVEQNIMQEILMDSANTGDIRWTLPADWREQETSGIRFASFRSQTSDIETVIVGFPGEVGTLEDNVLRWLRQMEANVSLPLLSAYLNGIIPRTNAAGILYLDVDLTEFAEYGRDEAIIVAIIRFNDQSVFIKMQDERRKLVQERANFNDFMASLRLESSPSAENKPSSKKAS